MPRALFSLGLLLAGVAIGLAVAEWRLAAGPDTPAGGWTAWSPAIPWLLGGVAVALLFAARRLERRRLLRARLTPETFLSAGEEERVVAAIRSFEDRTSGEIRVHLDHRVAGDLLAAAHARFGELGLERTRDRNGILFYVAVGQRRFAVVGDVGIDRATADDFWAGIVRSVEERFRAGDHVGGLVLGIERAGAELATHFPHRADDVNELPDGISRSETDD